MKSSSLMLVCLLFGTKVYAQVNLYDSVITHKTKIVSLELQRLILPDSKIDYDYIFGRPITHNSNIKLCYFKLETHPTPYDYSAFLASFSNQGQIVDTLRISLGDYFTDFEFSSVSEEIIELKLKTIKIDSKIYSSEFYKNVPDYVKRTEIVGNNYLIDNSPAEFKVFESRQVYFHFSQTGYIQTLDRYYESNFNRKYAFVSNRKIDLEELKLYSKQQLRIMRNEMFAKYGYIFDSKELQDTFATYSWYVPRYKDVNKYLSEIEKYNIKLIIKSEASMN